MSYYEEDLPEVKRFFLYLRKSTDESSGKQIQSIESQREECIYLAHRGEIEIVDVMEEEKSAHNPRNRPVFTAMLKELKIKNPKKRRADGILAYAPDRLSRNSLESGEIIQMIDDGEIKDLCFVTYPFTNTAPGKEHLAIEFARAKVYSDHLSNSVSRGMNRREKEGALMYGGKFGYDKIREDMRNPERSSLFPKPHLVEFPTIKEIFRLRLDGESFQSIHEHLEQQNLLNKSGNVPLKTSIGRYLKDDFYYGLQIIKKGTEKERSIDYRDLTARDGSRFPAVVTEEEFQRCQQISRGAIPRKIKTKRQHPLSGLLKTVEGYPLYAAERPVRRADGPEMQLGYECHDKRSKPPRRIKAVIVFEAIEEVLRNLCLTEKEYDQFIIGQRGFIEKKRSNRKYKKKGITEKIHKTERALEDLEVSKATLSRQGEFDNDSKTAHEKQKHTLKQSLLTYREEEKEMNQGHDQDMKTFTDFLELSHNAHYYWASANHDQKRQIAEILVLNLIVDGNEVQSVTLKKPFDKWLKGSLVCDGGHART